MLLFKNNCNLLIMKKIFFLLLLSVWVIPSAIHAQDVFTDLIEYREGDGETSDLVVDSLEEARVTAAERAATEGRFGNFVTCEGAGCTSCNLVEMGNKILNWLIGIMMVIFAGIVAYSGFKLVISGGNPSAKTEAKKWMTNAFIGIVIVLAAWLFVDTLMRALLPGGNGQINSLPWSKIECIGQTDTEEGTPIIQVNSSGIPTVCNMNYASYDPDGDGPEAPKSTYGCPDGIGADDMPQDCVKVEGGMTWRRYVNPYWSCPLAVAPNVEYDPNSDIPIVVGNAPAKCSGNSCVAMSSTVPCKNGCSVSADLAPKINNFHADVEAAGVGGTRVTEAMPPSQGHQSGCHTEGTCIDYSKIGGMTPKEVASVAAAAKANGLRPVYEVRTQAEKDILMAGKVNPDDILVESRITAPHFSIYGY